jgi:hypothetical protein
LITPIFFVTQPQFSYRFKVISSLHPDSLENQFSDSPSYHTLKKRWWTNSFSVQNKHAGSSNFFPFFFQVVPS